MKQNDEIENLFESTFEDFSVEPPPSLKIAIDEKIDFKRGFSKLWIFIPLILLLSFIGFMFVNNPNPVTDSNSFQLKASENSNKNENEEFNSKYKSENKFKSNKYRSENRLSNNVAVKSTGNTIEQSKNGTIHHNTNIKNESNPNTVKYTTTKESNPVNGLKSITKSSTKNKSIKHTNSKNKKATPKTDPILSATKKEETTIRTFSNSNTDHSGSVTGSENKNSNNNLTSLERKKEDPDNLKGKGIDNADNNKGVTTSDSNKINASNPDKAIDSVENKNDVADNGKSNDSLPTSVPLADTTKNNIAKTSSTASWLLSARFGSSIASNAITNKDYKISETSTFFINTEASYLFTNNFSITSGFQYNKITNGLQYSTTKYYYVEIGTDSLTIPNPNDTTGNPGDTTIYITVYDSSLVNVLYDQIYSHSSISIPIYFGYNYEINDKWFIDINGGIILSYQQAKRISSDPEIPDPTIRSFGMKACVRPQIRYQFNDKFGVSFSSNFGYDFVPTMKWSDISRTRIYSEFGIGIHYGF